MKHSHFYLSLESLSGVPLTHGVLAFSWAQKSALGEGFQQKIRKNSRTRTSLAGHCPVLSEAVHLT